MDDDFMNGGCEEFDVEDYQAQMEVDSARFEAELLEAGEQARAEAMVYETETDDPVALEEQIAVESANEEVRHNMVMSILNSDAEQTGGYVYEEETTWPDGKF